MIYRLTNLSQDGIISMLKALKRSIRQLISPYREMSFGARHSGIIAELTVELLG